MQVSAGHIERVRRPQVTYSLDNSSMTIEVTIIMTCEDEDPPCSVGAIFTRVEGVDSHDFSYRKKNDHLRRAIDGCLRSPISYRHHRVHTILCDRFVTALKHCYYDDQLCLNANDLRVAQLLT